MEELEESEIIGKQEGLLNPMSIDPSSTEEFGDMPDLECSKEDEDENMEIVQPISIPVEKDVKKSNKLVNNPSNNKKEEARYRPLNLPLARIKQIIKMDPDVHLAGSDAVFLIAKAAEMFIELLSKDSYAITAASKKKTIQRKDVEGAVQNTDSLVFLDGAMDF